MPVAFGRRRAHLATTLAEFDLDLTERIAAGVLQYRSDRIEDAAWNAANTLERKASQQGNDNAAMNNFERAAYDGIRFPWEGGYTGRESTESYFFGGHEIHITADVALAFWRPYLATGDEQWLADKGWPIISGTADFWVSRSTLGSDGKYHVLNVTPPDEWASNGNCGRDDNPYTNVAASKNIEIALQAAQILGHAAKPAWSARAGHYYIPMDDSRGVALEYADYDGRTIKQADVVMLTYPWEHAQSAELTGRNLDYYSTKVDEHASPSMTDAMHSIVAAELGRAEEAYWYTQRSAGGFLRGELNQFTEERSGGHAFTFTAAVGSPLTIDTRKSVDGGDDDGYGTLVGALKAEPGNDNRPGTYVYPRNGVFTEGSFDMTDFKVYRDGDKVNLVTRVNGEILNPWALEAMSLQLVHAYIRTADATTTGVTPALTGTTVNTESPWQYVAIANPRQQGGSIGGTGLYDAAGNLVGQASSAASKQTLRVVKAKTSSVKIITKKFKKGTRPALRVKIATLTNGRQATGRVRIKVGKKTVRTVKVVAKNKGSVTVRLPKRYRATIKVKATYVPTPKASVEGKASKVVKVRATR